MIGSAAIADFMQGRLGVTDALTAGCRLIDTAVAYGSEEAAGAAIDKSGILRSGLLMSLIQPA